VKRTRQRVSPPRPKSLIIKARGAVPHEGGLRFAPDLKRISYILRWLSEGMTYSLPDEPASTNAVFRATAVITRAGPGNCSFRRYSTKRARRDGLAAFDSNDKEIAKVDEHGLITGST
jgi:hypothetical protein